MGDWGWAWCLVVVVVVVVVVLVVVGGRGVWVVVVEVVVVVVEGVEEKKARVLVVRKYKLTPGIYVSDLWVLMQSLRVHVNSM